MPSSPSDIFGRKSYIKYPSPFLDIASTYTPPTMKEMFRWTRFFYYSSSTMSPIVYKLSEYSVTGLIYEGKQKNQLKYIMEKGIKIKTKMVEMNLDYHVFGNCFVSIFFPFRRFLQCPSCKQKHPIRKIDYTWKRMKFMAKCKKCSHEGAFKVVDENVRIKKEVRLIRWTPYNIDIDWNPVTDEHVYTYRLPNKVKRDIQSGKKMYLERMPKVFLDAAINDKSIELDNNNLYHFKRPNIADQDMGWGMPVILPVLKDVFFLNILRKGNEAISFGHVVPWRIIFPSGNNDASPYVNTDLGSWKSKVESEIKKWRKDNNHISVMPLPSGFHSFGGDAKVLGTTAEEKQVMQTIAGGLGVPLELMFGTMSWSGSSVSLRILENHFINSRESMDNFLEDFLIRKLSNYFGIKGCKVKQKNFKMADDIQFKNLAVNLMTQGKLSTSDVLDEMGFDYEKQVEKMEEELEMDAKLMKKRMMYQTITENTIMRLRQIAQTRMQLEQAEATGVDPNEGIQGDGQAPSGQKAQEAGQVQDHNVAADVPSMVVHWAANIAKLPQGERNRAIERIRIQSPHTAAAIEDEVKKLLKGIQANQAQGQALPEQRPPRSESASV